MLWLHQICKDNFMACCHPKLVSRLSWIPTLLLRACFVGTTCKMRDVIHKCLEATPCDNITSHCLNGWSQFSLAGGSKWQWDLKKEMIKSSFSVGSLTVLTWTFTLGSNSEVYLAMTHKPFLLLKLEAGAWTLVLQEYSLWSRPDHALLMWKFTWVAAVISFFTGNELNCFLSLGLAQAVSKKWCK